MPDQVGRTAYRIVQEGLTNVRKHAPGVTVLRGADRLAGRGRDHPDPEPRTHPLLVGGANPPGAGLGLVGLGERAKLAGGELSTRLDGGSFELTGWLPWQT